MKEERVFLGHIREAVADINSYASAGEAVLLADRMRQDAISQTLEIVGEAVKQLS